MIGIREIVLCHEANCNLKVFDLSLEIGSHNLLTPPGELIEHCSSGHLLLLTLAAGNAQERRITRDECTSLNAVAESMARQSKENI